jgi:pilus assembly protein CpaB
MRAISVRVNDVAGVAGFVLPGMRVDVLFTGHAGNQSDTVTRTVLQDVQVLSAGQTTQTDGKSQAIVVPVVTLLVNPADAESLTLANGEGRIQLVLRNSGDRQVSPTRGRQLREILFSPAAAIPDPPPPAAAARVKPRPAPLPVSVPAAVKVAEIHVSPPAADEVIVMNGKTQTRVVFQRGGAQ